MTDCSKGDDTMIKDNIEKVKTIIAECRQRRNVGADEPVTLIAVTKNHDVSAMQEAIDAGITVVGENRVQEAQQKFAVFGKKLNWHLIGHLQTNKVAAAVEIFDLIHSVDSEHLLSAIQKSAQKINKVQDILLQVNLAREESKFGIYKEDLPALLEKTEILDNIRLCGLMCIAPNYENREDCRPLFREMKEIFQKVKDLRLSRANIIYLSMGMTNDYNIAIEEGANMVRVGTAIFGPRQY